MPINERNSRRMDRDGLARMRRRIGVVHQDCQFIDHLSIHENVALPLTVAGRDVAVEAANLEQLLGWVGLSRRANALPPELSGGERQRISIARALIGKAVGDSIEVNAPGGARGYEVVEVRYG